MSLPFSTKPAAGEQLDRPPIGGSVERHRQIEVARIHTDGRTGNGHPLRISRELEFGRRGAERGEVELPIAQNRHFAVGHPAVHPSRHLQDLIGAEMQAMEHVAAPLHHVAVSGVVDDHGIETRHVEGRLTRGRHRQQERALDLALEEGADDPDRLAAVIEGGRQPRPLGAQARRQLLDFRPGRHEHGHSPLLLDQAADVPLVEELLRLLRQDLDLRLEVGIERLGREHFRAVEVLRHKKWDPPSRSAR